MLFVFFGSVSVSVGQDLCFFLGKEKRRKEGCAVHVIASHEAREMIEEGMGFSDEVASLLVLIGATLLGVERAGRSEGVSGSQGKGWVRVVSGRMIQSHGDTSISTLP